MRLKFICGQGAVPGRTDGRPTVYSGVMPVSAASGGGAERCAGLAAVRSARRLPVELADSSTVSTEPNATLHLIQPERD